MVSQSQAVRAHEVVHDSLSACGLTVNANKTKVWCCDAEAQLPAPLAAREVTELKLLGSTVAFLDRHDDPDSHGVPLCGTVDGQSVLEDTRGLNRRLAELRGAGLRAKTAYTVLHTYAQSCCNHLQRAKYEVGHWVSNLDDELVRGLEALAGESLCEARRGLASLRLKEGGLAFGGLRAHCSPVPRQLGFGSARDRPPPGLLQSRGLQVSVPQRVGRDSAG